jgi:S-adenosylmethionine synthetase
VNDDFIFTSESITRGHPDKLCDQISDAIIDHFVKRDPHSSVIAECAVASGVLFIAARYASKARVDIPEVARDVIRGVGYPKQLFDADACTIMTSFTDLTASEYEELDLDAMGDAEIGRITAKNPVTAFGYACRQSPTLMPLPIWLAHRLADVLAAEKTRKQLAYLLPDGKSQVSIEYRDGKPDRIHSITIVASQTDEQSVDPAELRGALIEHVIRPVCDEAEHLPDDNTRIFVNPEGPVIGGGPAAHSGLTGRKTGVDTYGEYARHSGAALSGKDPMRIDRVGAYVARYAAKNVVAANLATECEVQLSYSVGVAEPVSVRVRTFGTGTLDDNELSTRVRDVFDFRVAAIVRDLRLRALPAEAGDGFYERLAVYGHMGRTDLKATWEKTDKVDALK